MPLRAGLSESGRESASALTSLGKRDSPTRSTGFCSIGQASSFWPPAVRRHSRPVLVAALAAVVTVLDRNLSHLRWRLHPEAVVADGGEGSSSDDGLVKKGEKNVKGV